MLSRSARLTQRRDFQRVYRTGRSRPGALLWLKYGAGEGSATRVGIVISTKVAAKATDRNRLKRQLREIIRQELAKKAATTAKKYDIVLSATPRAKKADFEGLAQAVSQHFSHLF